MDVGDLKGGALIHGNGDDATPWNINGTYIGGNHGCSDARELTCPNHGMTVTDLGSQWVDEAGTKFYLVKIADENRLWFLSQDFGRDDIWKFSTKVVGSNLKRTTGGSALDFEKVQMVQLRPACRIKRRAWGKMRTQEGERRGRIGQSVLRFRQLRREIHSIPKE